MPFDKGLFALREIIESIELIEQFTVGMDLDMFLADQRTSAAVERKLQNVSEAAIRLGSEAERICPGPPWRDIRGIGNWLRHQYDKVDSETVWYTVQDDLPPLKAAVQRVLDGPSG